MLGGPVQVLALDLVGRRAATAATVDDIESEDEHNGQVFVADGHRPAPVADELGVLAVIRGAVDGRQNGLI